ncbi:MAG TPA: hypothetical protein VGG74_21785 [Kofleriaceae bacterium]|jgi:hypothetical protein
MTDENKRSTWVGNAAGGNYTLKVQALADKMGVGINDIDVAHDDWCALLKSGQPCNCDPDVRVRPQAPKLSEPRQDAAAAPKLASSLKALADQIVRKLGAKPAADPPARAVFEAGVIYLGETEIGIEFTGLGHFFVRDGGGGQVVVEGVVVKELDRTEKRRRHRKLQKWGKKIFGDDMVIHDPLGYAGGPKSPTS